MCGRTLCRMGHTVPMARSTHAHVPHRRGVCRIRISSLDSRLHSTSKHTLLLFFWYMRITTPHSRDGEAVWRQAALVNNRTVGRFLSLQRSGAQLLRDTRRSTHAGQGAPQEGCKRPRYSSLMVPIAKISVASTRVPMIRKRTSESFVTRMGCSSEI